MKEPKRRLMVEVVRVMGVDYAETLLQEALEVEKKGGLFVNPNPKPKQTTESSFAIESDTDHDHGAGNDAVAVAGAGAGETRKRRSPGGVFLFLLRQKCSKTQWKQIMEVNKQFKNQHRGRAKGKPRRTKKSSSGGGGGGGKD